MKRLLAALTSTDALIVEGVALLAVAAGGFAWQLGVGMVGLGALVYGVIEARFTEPEKVAPGDFGALIQTEGE